MDVRELSDFIDAHYQQPGDRLFRMEVLPEYDVSSDGEDFRRWLAGEREPTWARKEGWLKILRDDKRRGLLSSRVRILSEQLTDYEKYACAWGYFLNGAFEDIRVLRRGEHPLPAGLVEADYWLIGDEHVLLMHYDEHGRFEAAERLDQPLMGPYLYSRDVAMAAAEPFHDWWDRHAELHRILAA